MYYNEYCLKMYVFHEPLTLKSVKLLGLYLTLVIYEAKTLLRVYYLKTVVYRRGIIRYKYLTTVFV